MCDYIDHLEEGHFRLSLEEEEKKDRISNRMKELCYLPQKPDIKQLITFKHGVPIICEMKIGYSYEYYCPYDHDIEERITGNDRLDKALEDFQVSSCYEENTDGWVDEISIIISTNEDEIFKLCNHIKENFEYTDRDFRIRHIVEKNEESLDILEAEYINSLYEISVSYNDQEDRFFLTLKHVQDDKSIYKQINRIIDSDK